MGGLLFDLSGSYRILWWTIVALGSMPGSCTCPFTTRAAASGRSNQRHKSACDVTAAGLTLRLVAILLALWLLFFALSLRFDSFQEQASGTMLTIFPPHWTIGERFEALHTDPQAGLVRTTFLPNIWVVQSDSAGFAGALRQRGAWGVYDAQSFLSWTFGGCGWSASGRVLSIAANGLAPAPVQPEPLRGSSSSQSVKRSLMACASAFVGVRADLPCRRYLNGKVTGCALADNSQRHQGRTAFLRPANVAQRRACRLPSKLKHFAGQAHIDQRQYPAALFEPS